MSFLQPEFLYYMLLPLGIFFFFILTQEDKQSSFFSSEVFARLQINSKRLTLRKRNMIYFAISILVIFALAEPVIPDGKVEVQKKSADIMIALDVSNSMRAQDVYPSRLRMAQHKILELLSLLPEDRVGVIAFAKASYLVSPLSFDHDAVRFLVKRLQPDNITKQGTDFGQLLYSTNRSIQNKKDRYLIIFTDGGDQKSFQDEIEYAQAHNIKVFVIGIGTQKGAPIKTATGFMTYKGKIVITRFNKNIASLATQTGGVYIKGVLSNADVKKMVEEIGAKTHQKLLKTHTVRHDISLFYYPLALALFLLVIAMSSIGEIRRHAGLFIVLLLCSYQVPSQAGILDFKTLDEANNAYKNHDYAKSSRLFAEYQKERNSADVQYDRANALYKDTHYKQAAEIYKKLHFQDRIKQANALYNLGNAYTKQGNEEALKKALQAYKKALSLHEDPHTRFNLRVVKELLKQKQQKKQQKKQQQNSNKNQKNKQNKQKQKEQQSRSQNQKNAKTAKKSQDNKTKQQNKNSKNGQNKSAGQSKQNNKDNKSDQNKAQDHQMQNKQKGTQTSQQKGEKEQARQKSGAKQSPIKSMQQKEQKGHTAQTQPSNQAPMTNNQQIKKDGMSKSEVKQWLKQIQYNAPTHIYKMQQMQTQMKDENEKPW